MLTKAAILTWWLLAATYLLGLVLGTVWWSEPQIGVYAAPSPEGQMVITRLYPGGPVWSSGARVGDILLKVDGIDIDEQTWKIRGDSGTKFVIQAVGDDARSSTLIEGRPPINSLARAVSLWTIGLAFAITSFFIFSRSRRSPEVLTLSILFLAFAIAFAVAPAAARGNPWAMYVEVESVHWVAALFVIFFLLFWRGPHHTLHSAKYLGWGMGAWALTLSPLHSLSITLLPGAYEVGRWFGLLEVAIGLLGGGAFLFLAYLRTDSLIKKEQSRIMLVGIGTAVFPFALLTVVPQVIGITPFLQPELTVLAIALVPLSFAYAIMRHQLMGMRRLVHRGAAYALISATVIIIYGGLITFLRVAGGQDLSENTIAQVILLVVLFAAIPSVSGTRRLAFAAVDRLLYRDHLDHSDLVTRASLGAASARNLDELSRTVLSTIAQELRLSFAAFIGVTEGRPVVKSSVGIVSQEITQKASALAAGTEEEPVAAPGGAIQYYADQEVLVALKGQGQNTWILCLGPKFTEEPFNREDLNLAQSVAGQVATIVEKLELLEQLQVKTVELKELNRRLVRTQEEERARIASYLHDDPLQQIANLMWHHDRVELPPKVRAELQRIAEDLRNFTARLQPAVLEDLGLVRALEWLGAEASVASGFRFVFDPGPIGRDDPLNPEVALALYRIAQEALTNCQKHAKASTVWMRLTRYGERITLCVEDDGIGFLPPRESEPSRRLGLIGMRERAEQLGGHFHISSHDPFGTRVVVSLPLENSVQTRPQ